ncbi:ribonucleoside-diphosphate reductase large chain, partial [Cystoisospora suis]
MPERPSGLSGPAEPCQRDVSFSPFSPSLQVCPSPQNSDLIVSATKKVDEPVGLQHASKQLAECLWSQNHSRCSTSPLSSLSSMVASQPAMYVVNRRGEKEPVSFDQILRRVSRLAYGLHPLVDPARVTQAVINGMYAGIKTSELDELAAQTSAYMAASHPDFSKLAARIAIDNLHKNTSGDFVCVMRQLNSYIDKWGRDAKLVSDEVFEFVEAHARELNAAIDYSRDFDYDYFGFKTLERSYLLKVHDRIVERP